MGEAEVDPEVEDPGVEDPVEDLVEVVAGQITLPEAKIIVFYVIRMAIG